MPNTNPSNKATSESIDEVIIRLLGLKVGVELDYQTYFKILKNKLLNARLGGKQLQDEEDKLLRDELKRVKREIDKTGGKRFKVKEKRTKVTSKNSTNTPYSSLKGGGALVKSPKSKLNADKFVFVNVKDITEKISDTKEEQKIYNFDELKKILDSINEILKSKFKFDQKQSEKERISEESNKRKKKESTLEGFKKGIAGIVSATKKILSPFQNIIDRILRFIFFTLLGRAFTKFMEWLNDKGNQEKFNAFVDFLSDHWPVLAGLYILFGTSFGKLVRGLLKGAARMTVALVMNIGKIKRFIAKNKKLAFLGVAIAPLATRELGNIFGENKETPESGLIPKQGVDLKDAQQSVDEIKETPAPRIQTANVGGIIPKFNLGGIIPSFARGGFNSYGGMDFSQEIPIKPLPGGDDTIIAAKTGEAVLTEEDQQDIGQRYVDRFTGNPLNIPQYLAGRNPGSVSMDSIKFSGFGGGFNLGGVVQKFNAGGIVGKNPTPEELSQRAYGNTVRIESQGSPGSGVLVNNNDGLYTVLTAGHVVDAAMGEEINIITSDGKRHIIKRDENNYRDFQKEGIDLGQLIFKSNQNYPVATPGDLKKLTDNDNVFVGGFPLLKDSNGNESQSSAMRFIQGNIIPGSRGDTAYPEGGYTMGYNMATYPGMSGGPVFNNKGELIGIHGRGISDDISTNQKEWGSAAIPISNYLNRGGTFGSTSNTRSTNSNIFTKLMSLESLRKENEVQDNYLQQKGFNVEDTFKRTKSWNVDKKQGGGLISESTGMNIPGATADRQSIAGQPGEYVLPTETVFQLGGPSVIDTIVAMTDSNSTPFKRGVLSKNNITPYRNNSFGMNSLINLPPITSSAGGATRARSSGLAGGSQVPSFSYRHPNGSHNVYAEIYGIAG